MIAWKYIYIYNFFSGFKGMGVMFFVSIRSNFGGAVGFSCLLIRFELGEPCGLSESEDEKL